MNKAFIPLNVSKDVEAKKSWEGISTPNQLASYLAKVLFLDAEKILALNEIHFSDEQPVGDDTGRIWINSIDPVFIGIPAGGGYKKIYQHPVGTPFLWNGTVPPYLSRLTDSQVSDYGLKDPSSSTINWVIFEPED